MNAPSESTADVAAHVLSEQCRQIPFLTIHGVGIGDDTLIVYCRAKRNAQRQIPVRFEHDGATYTVKYVLCSVAPAALR